VQCPSNERCFGTTTEEITEGVKYDSVRPISISHTTTILGHGEAKNIVRRYENYHNVGWSLIEELLHERCEISFLEGNAQPPPNFKNTTSRAYKVHTISS
jgi:hypothetical protein